MPSDVGGEEVLEPLDAHDLGRRSEMISARPRAAASIASVMMNGTILP